MFLSRKYMRYKDMAQLKECDLRRAKFSRTDIRFAKMQKTKIDLEGAVYLAGLLGAVVN